MTLLGGFIVPHPPLIIPEIGRGEEQQIQATITAYQTIGRTIAALQPDTIVIITPHSVLYRDYLHISPGTQAVGDFSRFGQPKVRFTVRYDSDFVARLVRLSEEAGIPAGTLGEGDPALDHGTMVPLHFINQYYHNYQVVRISISGLSLQTHYQFGKLIAQAAAESGKQVVIVASGDLSHRLKEDGPYGFAEEGPVFDREVTQAMETGDFARTSLGKPPSWVECGLKSFIILAGMAGKLWNCFYHMRDHRGGLRGGFEIQVMSMSASARTARNITCIGASCLVLKASVRAGKSAGWRVCIAASRRASCGLYRYHQPHYRLHWDEIIQNAISAGMRDPASRQFCCLSCPDGTVSMSWRTGACSIYSGTDPKRYALLLVQAETEPAAAKRKGLIRWKNSCGLPLKQVFPRMRSIRFPVLRWCGISEQADLSNLSASLYFSRRSDRSLPSPGQCRRQHHCGKLRHAHRIGAGSD